MAADAQAGPITVPTAQFIRNVDDFLAGRTPEAAIQALDNNYRNYRLIEQNLLQSKARLIGKLPEIQKAEEAVALLIRKREAEQELLVDFAISDQVFAKAKVPVTDSVNLWLGANVMLEYPLEEARDLLAQNIKNCKANLKQNQQDLELVKDSITTTEVSIARVYNHDVSQRRTKKP
ncbi:hypothetical protein WJX79_008020 [Trebouxia sp. C0005]|nr:MAG: Prefoldin subunit 3 [Trebouxia sp. A1-2]